MLTHKVETRIDEDEGPRTSYPRGAMNHRRSDLFVEDTLNEWRKTRFIRFLCALPTSVTSCVIILPKELLNIAEFVQKTGNSVCYLFPDGFEIGQKGIWAVGRSEIGPFRVVKMEDLSCFLRFQVGNSET